MGRKGIESRFKGFFRFPYVSLLIISGLFLLLYLVVTFRFPNAGRIQGWLSRLTVATLTSYLTAIFVEKSFRDEQRREKERRKSAALRHFQLGLNLHLFHLANMYTASLPERPDSLPKSWEELFSDDFVDTVSHLDYSAQSPTYVDDEDWLLYTAEELDSFHGFVEGTINKYGTDVDSAMIETLQSLSGTSLYSLIIPISRRYSPPEALANNSERKSAAKQVGPASSESVKEHIENVKDMIKLYHGEDTPDILHIEATSIYTEEIKPFVGSARLDESFVEQEKKKKLNK